MKPKFLMLVGIPGSGKSTYAKELAEKEDYIILSSDEMREVYFGDVNDQKNNNELFSMITDSIKGHLSCKQSVIMDATNLNSKKRKNLLNEIKSIECDKKCVVVAMPYSACLHNNKNRDRNVPENVIKRMYMTFQMPYYFEGWDEIEIIYPDKMYVNYLGMPNIKAINLADFSQDNPHHKLSLGNHLIATRDNMKKLDRDYCASALLHDVGKEFCKSFKDKNGNNSTVAHYFNHENVSAYDSMFYEFSGDHIFVGAIITYHMRPFQWVEDKTKDKYRKLFGEELYEAIMILHDADVIASVGDNNE